jgi:hypothetical protein
MGVSPIKSLESRIWRQQFLASTDLPAASPFQLSPIGEKSFFRVKVQ